NYGLLIDTDRPEQSVEVISSDGSPGRVNEPWTARTTPVRLKARGQRIPQWTLEHNGLIGRLCSSPVTVDTPVEEITLIPMGAARLRVSAFPRVGEGPPASETWGESDVEITASVYPPK